MGMLWQYTRVGRPRNRSATARPQPCSAACTARLAAAFRSSPQQPRLPSYNHQQVQGPHTPTHVLPSGRRAPLSTPSSISLLLPGARASTLSAAAAAEPTRDRNWSLRATKSVSELTCFAHRGDSGEGRERCCWERLEGGWLLRAAGSRGRALGSSAPSHAPPHAPPTHLHHRRHAIALCHAHQPLGRVPGGLLGCRRHALFAQLPHRRICRGPQCSAEQSEQCGGQAGGKW